MVELGGEHLYALPYRDGGVDDGDKKTPKVTKDAVWRGFLKEGVSLDTSDAERIDALQRLDIDSLRKLHRLAIPSDIGDEAGCVGIYRSDVVGLLTVKDIFDDSVEMTLGDDDQKLVIHVAPFGMQMTHALIGKDSILREESVLCAAIDFKRVLMRYKDNLDIPALCDGITNIDFARLMVSHFGFRPTRFQVVSNAGVEFIGPSADELRDVYSAQSLDSLSRDYQKQLFEIFAFSKDLFTDENAVKIDRVIGVFSARVQKKYDIQKEEQSAETAEKIARSRVIVECVNLNKDRYK